MANELVDGGAPESEAPKEDLRSIIEAAVEEQKSDAPDGEAAREPKGRQERQERQERGPAELPRQQGERARDPATGRFVEGQQEPPRLVRQEAPQGPQPQAQAPRPQDGAGLRPPDGW